MQRFSLLECKHNVDLARKWLAHDVFLTKNTIRGTAKISYCYHLNPDEALMAVGLMYGILEIGMDGQRFGVRFPLPGDHRLLKEDYASARRSYRKPLHWLCRFLLRDEDLARAEREGMDLADMCREFDVPADLCEIAVALWRAKRSGVVAFR